MSTRGHGEDEGGVLGVFLNPGPTCFLCVNDSCLPNVWDRPQLVALTRVQCLWCSPLGQLWHWSCVHRKCLILPLMGWGCVSDNITVANSLYGNSPYIIRSFFVSRSLFKKNSYVEVSQEESCCRKITGEMQVRELERGVLSFPQRTASENLLSKVLADTDFHNGDEATSSPREISERDFSKSETCISGWKKGSYYLTKGAISVGIVSIMLSDA